MVEIRPGTKSDLPQVGELWRQLVRHHVERDARLPPEALGGAEKWRNRLARSLRDHTLRLFVADADGRVVGFTTGMIDHTPDVFQLQRFGKVLDIFVEQTWRRQGLARRLMAALTDWFKAEQLDHVEMNLVAANQDAAAFWRGIGGLDYTARLWLPLNWDEES